MTNARKVPTSTKEIVEFTKKYGNVVVNATKKNALPVAKDAVNLVASEISSAANKKMSPARTSMYVSLGFAFSAFYNGDLLYSGSLSIFNGMLALYQSEAPQALDKFAKQNFGISVSEYVMGYFTKPQQTQAKPQQSAIEENNKNNVTNSDDANKLKVN